jgi:hypothetical protein
MIVESWLDGTDNTSRTVTCGEGAFTARHRGTFRSRSAEQAWASFMARGRVSRVTGGIVVAVVVVDKRVFCIVFTNFRRCIVF